VKIISKAEGKFLLVEVVDSGIGIKELDKVKLFKLFGLSGLNIEMNTNGIGLGLLVSRHLVDQLEGELSFESQPNKGSTFRFTVKLQEEPNVEPFL
jgi:two-component system, NarL family, sensor histidine kinase BarA